LSNTHFARAKSTKCQFSYILSDIQFAGAKFSKDGNEVNVNDDDDHASTE
jgi:hypothetical protein